MVKTTVIYTGNLGCTLLHDPSQTAILTDAPVDNGGKGTTFSPTDLVGSALGACMATIMGKVAERKNLNLSGMTIHIGKEMSASPRRIAKLSVTITMPLAETHPDKNLLINAAMTCPVHGSLHPDIEIPITWHWIG